MQAEVIMALAKSNGGCWSTAYYPKSGVKLINDNNLLCGESEAGIVSKMALPQELHGRLSFNGTSSHAIKSGDRVSTQAGNLQT